MLAWSKKSHSQVEVNDIMPPTSEPLGVNNAEFMDQGTDKNCGGVNIEPATLINKWILLKMCKKQRHGGFYTNELL